MHSAVKKDKVPSKSISHATLVASHFLMLRNTEDKPRIARNERMIGYASSIIFRASGVITFLKEHIKKKIAIINRYAILYLVDFSI